MCTACSLKGFQWSVLVSTKLLTNVSEVYTCNIFLPLLPSETVLESAAEYRLLCY